MLCGNCGNKVPERELYCFFCGADMEVFASSTEKELEALKMLEEQLLTETAKISSASEEGAFLEEAIPQEKKEEKPLFFEEEFGAGLDMREVSTELEESEKGSSSGEEKISLEEIMEEKEEASPLDKERQRQYAQFFEEEPVPGGMQTLQEGKEKEEENILRIEDDL